jgi:hypothetical protein
MKAILASALALGLMTSAALAAPVKLTATQMDSVKAGQSIAVVCGVDGRCLESRGPVAAVSCVNGQCECVSGRCQEVVLR